MSEPSTIESIPRKDDPCFNCGTKEAADFLIFDTPHHPDGDDHSMKLCLSCCDIMAGLVTAYINDNPAWVEQEEKRTDRTLHHYRYLKSLGYEG